MFTAQVPNSCLRSSALIAFNDPSVVLDDHWTRKWKSKCKKSKIENVNKVEKLSQSGKWQSRKSLSVNFSCWDYVLDFQTHSHFTKNKQRQTKRKRRLTKKKHTHINGCSLDIFVKLFFLKSHFKHYYPRFNSLHLPMHSQTLTTT